MLSIKKFLPVLLIIAPVLFSTNSFAFDMPKEFVSMNNHKFSQTALFETKEAPVYEAGNGSSKTIKALLLSEYLNWKGTHYRLGGTTHKGVDCSALMQHLFNASLHQQLPRTTFQQIKNGEKISKNDLKPGDLVFFKTSSRDRHVGVYVGDNQFIHASKIEGVTISSLDNQYWINHYETARRLELMS
ncbi:NlpC/P60 family protein [Rahnella woolbedingensis]|uniref:Glycoside hydrolase n=1 Tax=Rahnella woolbedingensis TaxID=1510574 RepID=A0A419N408_9GAMM|nr:NlpC/P60 family protein [Rahnella woolbedingensis]RJT39155.1 glycoside hydrolase [Rahnella woolbedingensis]